MLWATPAAHADRATLAEIERLSKEAMDSFDMLEIEQAKKLLSRALTLAIKAKLENAPAMARVHLNLAVIYASGDQRDLEVARVEVIKAVNIDPKITLAPAYKTAELESMLAEVKTELGVDSAPKPGTKPTPAAVDCSSVTGLSHNLIDTAKRNTDLFIEALLGGDVSASKVSLHYRFQSGPGASPTYTEVQMKRSGCQYTATVAGYKLQGDVMHYYIAAYDDGGNILVRKGSASTPNIVELQADGGGTSGDESEENPLLGSGAGISDEVGGKSAPTLFVSAAFGTGGAYVTGETEQLGSAVNCCFAPALLHVFPELGYYISKQMSVSLGFRIGFPIGANLPNHATAAPAALVRLRRSFSASGEGLHWAAALGGGVIRQTVKLQSLDMQGMDTDTTAIGPLLVGAGVGYSRTLGGPARFLAELNTSAGVPVVDSIGTARLNFGVQIDINIGLVLAF